MHKAITMKFLPMVVAVDFLLSYYKNQIVCEYEKRISYQHYRSREEEEAAGDVIISLRSFHERCEQCNSFTITTHSLCSCFVCSDIRFTGHMPCFRFLHTHAHTHFTYLTHTDLTLTLMHTFPTYHPQASRIHHQMV